MTPQPQPAVTVETDVKEILGAAERLGVLPAKFQPVGGSEGHDGCNRCDQHTYDGRNDNTRRHFVCFVLGWRLNTQKTSRNAPCKKAKTSQVKFLLPVMVLPPHTE